MNISSLQVRGVEAPMAEPRRIASCVAPGSGVEFDGQAVQRYLA